MVLLFSRYLGGNGSMYSRAEYSLVARKNYFAEAAGPLVKANFALLVIFLVAYIVLFVLSILAAVRSRGHRLPYVVLFIGITFNVLNRILGVAATLLQYDSGATWSSYYNLGAVADTFDLIGTIVPLLAVLIILWDRAGVLQRMRPDRAICSSMIKKAFDIALAGLWLVIAIAYVALITANNKKYLGGPHDMGEFRNKVNTTYRILDVLQVFMFITVINIGITALALRSRIRSVTIGDAPTNRVAFIVFPLLLVDFLYMLGVTIFYDYVWVHRITLDRLVYEIVTIVSVIVSSSLLFIALLVILLTGISQTAWNALSDQGGKPGHGGQVYQPGVVYQLQYDRQQQHSVYGQPGQTPTEKGVVL